MSNPKRRSPGRMIRQDVSNSAKIASLSPEAAWLFFMLIPHFNAHGKMNGGAGYIKDEVAPLIKVFSYENIPSLLNEISEKTNVKRYEVAGRWYLQSLNFNEHQSLEKEKLGGDDLPNYQPICRGSTEARPSDVRVVELQYKGEEEVQGEGEDEYEGEDKNSLPSLSQNSNRPRGESVKSLFSKFWKAYPKKKSIEQAAKAFAKLNPNEQFLDRLIAAIERAKTSDQWRDDGGRFIPYPATWLNSKGWEDVYDVEVKPQPVENKFRQGLRRQMEQQPESSRELIGITDGAFDVEVVG